MALRAVWCGCGCAVCSKSPRVGGLGEGSSSSSRGPRRPCENQWGCRGGLCYHHRLKKGEREMESSARERSKGFD